MLIKSGLFLLLLTVLQVSARYKNTELDFIENEINSEPAAVSSSASRIVSGWEALPGQLPHHASLRMMSSTGNLDRCGGAIVSKEWVITTALCTRDRVSLVVRAGVLSISDNNPENIFETREWYQHPTYNNLSTNVRPHNIALVKLQRPVVYTRLLQPIRVQSSADAYRDYDGEQVYASGYGYTWTSGQFTDELRWVYLRAISNSACAKIYSDGIVADTTICAQFFNITSQSVCDGDGGAPLVHVGSDGVPTLIGIYAFKRTGSSGCHSGVPSGFTRPGPYLPWFKAITGIDFENLQEDEDDTSTSTITSTTTTTTTTVFEEQEPDEFTPEEGSTAPSEDSKEKEEDKEEEDSGSSEPKDDMAQLLKRLKVNSNSNSNSNSNIIICKT